MESMMSLIEDNNNPVQILPPGSTMKTSTSIHLLSPSSSNSSISSSSTPISDMIVDSHLDDSMPISIASDSGLKQVVTNNGCENSLLESNNKPVVVVVSATNQSTLTTAAPSENTKIVFFEMMVHLMKSMLQEDGYCDDCIDEYDDDEEEDNDSLNSIEVLNGAGGSKWTISSTTSSSNNNSLESALFPTFFKVNNSSSENPSSSLSASNQFPRVKNPQNGCPFMLQTSLFPMVYPTIYFTTEEAPLSKVPNEIKAFLRWKMTTITANTMKAIVLRSGYRIISADKNIKTKSFSNWNAIWCKHLKVTEFALVGYHQRVNHFPGSFNFGRKDRLWLNLKAKLEKYGHEAFGNFHPQTFILPHDYRSLIEYWNESNPPTTATSSSSSALNEESLEDGSNSSTKSDKTLGEDCKVFICKPPASARGQGINIVSTVDELHQLMTSSSTSSNNETNNGQSNGSASVAGSSSTNTSQNVKNRKSKSTLVVQEYIANPCLLNRNDAKFDLRVYALVTSISPLRLYVYEEGIVRFAANKYSKNITDIKNQFIHLTNYSVNKNCQEYVPSNSTDSEEGHKWTLKTLWRYLSMDQKAVASGGGDTAGPSVDNIWQQIIDMIVKTVISAESQILQLLKQHLKNKRSCFELLGFDIMIDDNFKLWLLEVNITPSLRADSVLDFSVKNQLVKDILNTLGYQLSPRFRKFYNFGQFFAPEKSDLLSTMKEPNEEKHRQYETLFLSGGFEACDNIIDQLNDDDISQLIESEDERFRCGQFTRIFPTANSRHYLQYFDFPYYYNLLLVVWEERYYRSQLTQQLNSRTREEGLNRIRSYMLNKPEVQESLEKLKIQLAETEKTLKSMKNVAKLSSSKL